MIAIDAAALQAIIKAAEASYPEECCGLLIGRRDGGGGIEISRIVAGENVATERKGKRFEIDPALRLRTTRALAGGPDTIVGHYHSHPDGRAQPSPTDVECAYEPHLAWVIVAVIAGRVTEAAAFRIANERVDALLMTVSPATPAALSLCGDA